MVSSGCDLKCAHPVSSVGCPFWGALPGGQDDLILLMPSATSLFPNMASFCGPGLGLQHRNLWGHNSSCNRAGGAVPPHQGVDTGSPSPLVRSPRHWLAADPAPVGTGPWPYTCPPGCARLCAGESCAGCGEAGPGPCRSRALWVERRGGLSVGSRCPRPTGLALAFCFHSGPRS